MTAGADRRSVLFDTLALVREELDAQAGVCEDLTTQLAAAQGRLSRLEGLYESLTESLPDLGIAGPTGAPEDSSQTDEGPAEESPELDDLRDAESNTLQDFILVILATSDRPMHVDHVLDTILHLREEGRTDKLGNSKRPVEDVRTALNRLVKKGRASKVGPSLYAVARAPENSEAA
ncbi:hypothetical protein HYE82_15550 [Streptomyces sp. BR123]|uniref:hypothetical protein n=1 Tax=Streptomyces sp. BR123 TaxID=2749828 RepID=UPI0015C4C6E8|nr:hypothetical protein [Streptomyces sp. BR123]NXY95780.1 hypothetical protein [Streptomyces sp. BR123]